MGTGKILLYGGGGFIGTNLMNDLVARDLDVVVVDIKKPATIPVDACFLEAGMFTRERSPEILREVGTVVYLASATYPHTSAHNMPMELSGNLEPMMNFMEMLTPYNNIHTIFFSSGGTVYGNASELPVTEKTPLAPINYYGAGKAAMEHFLRAFSHNYGHNITVLRPSNVYGPHQPFTKNFGLIRTIMEKILNNEQVEIWGTGEQKRDYLFVDDLILAVYLLISPPPNRNQFEVYNVSTGLGISILELCSCIEETININIPIHFTPLNSEQVNHIWLNSTKLTSTTGWQPRTLLPEGIKATWTWLGGSR